jgi:hypothetical protein
MRADRLLAHLLLALSAACSGTTAQVPDGPGGGDDSGAPSGDGGPVGGGTGVLYCPFGVVTTSPPPANSTAVSYDKSCAAAADCAIGRHYLDCCGSEIALGINVSEAARFDASGGICNGQGPLCACASQGLVAEDGQHSHDLEHLSDVSVACNAGRCETSIAP